MHPSLQDVRAPCVRQDVRASDGAPCSTVAPRRRLGGPPAPLPTPPAGELPSRALGPHFLGPRS